MVEHTERGIKGGTRKIVVESLPYIFAGVTSIFAIWQVHEARQMPEFIFLPPTSNQSGEEVTPNQIRNTERDLHLGLSGVGVILAGLSLIVGKATALDLLSRDRYS